MMIVYNNSKKITVDIKIKFGVYDLKQLVILLCKCDYNSACTPCFN